MRSLIHPSSPRRALFGSGVVRSIVALWVVGAVVLVAAWLGAPAAQAQSRSDVRFWTAQLEYEAGHYRQAFDMFAALADEGFAFTVSAVTPVTEAVEGGNVFRVEATLDAASPRLRPGMEGVAKIEAGERRLAWIWTRRFVSWLRLFLWTWTP